MHNHSRNRRFFLMILPLTGIAALFITVLTVLSIDASTSSIGQKLTIQNAKPKTPAVVPSLIISAREIDLGTLSMGLEREGTFTVKNIGGDALAWTILPPESWFPLEQTELSGVSTGNEESVTIRISVIKKDTDLTEIPVTANVPVQLTLEYRSNRLICVRDLPAGHHRDLIRIETPTGIRKTLFIKFNLIPKQEDTALDVNPPRMDFGLLKNDVAVTKRIRLVNQSRENIRWKTSVASVSGMTTNFMMDRYLSFSNEDVYGKGVYVIPERLEKHLQLSGSWKEYQGFPSINGKSILKLDFYGRSLALYVKKLNSNAQLNAYIDNNLIKTFEFAEADQDYEFYEIPVVDDLIETQHTLTLALNGSGIAVEGAQIGRQDVIEGKHNWITVFPESGFTLKETDYINITLTPSQGIPGIYHNTLQITSNNGSVDVPISFEVTSDIAPESIDIYRYFKVNTYLYVSNQPTEELRMTSRGFVKQGLAFRLFQPGTPGTIAFHRWYNPRIINQLYSHDYSKGSSMLGYVYEGVVGHIATSRLSNTRELFRWYNPKTKRHFFTLSPNGEGMGKKGYVFDGIAGYVK